jgi:hypothetical protein
MNFTPRFWVESHQGDPTAFRCYRRHYSAQKNKRPKIRQFVGPGEMMVLIGFLFSGLFVWRKERFRLDGQTGINCAVFRNESSAHLSSDLIREAVLFAWERWPGERLYTMVDGEKTKRRRGKRNPAGQCFLHAGWSKCGETQRGLVILEV